MARAPWASPGLLQSHFWSRPVLDNPQPWVLTTRLKIFIKYFATQQSFTPQWDFAFFKCSPCQLSAAVVLSPCPDLGSDALVLGRGDRSK